MIEKDTESGRLVMVVHGPEAFDCGDAVRLATRIRPSRIVVAGVMGRTAAEESGLPCEYGGIPPSRLIPTLEGRVFLLNRGKTPESGKIFGEIVASRLGESGLVQVECSNSRIYCWNKKKDKLIRFLSSVTGFPVEYMHSHETGNGDVRRIRGCIPGEAVYVNGIVIGQASDKEVVLTRKDGLLTPISGLVPKAHGLEKLHRFGGIDITTAWCKSGRVRMSAPTLSNPKREVGVVVYIDHCGHLLYSRLDDRICGIVSVGDDTTAVCGHIGAHLGLPVLGIVDGDGDGIVNPSFVSGSVILHVLEERDDDVGLEIKDKIIDAPVKWSEFVEEIIRILGSRVKVVIPEGT